MLDDRLGADDEMSYPVISQEREEIQDVLVEEGNFYFRCGRRGRSGGG